MRTVIKAYKYKLFASKRNRYLDVAIDIAASIWNFCIAMKRMYYLVYGEDLSANKLKMYIAKLKKRRKYAYWNKLGSQAIQDVVERVDRSYKVFFTHVKEKRHGRKSPPGFKKRKKYTSFTLKQCGYAFLDGGRVKIMGHIYRYDAHRPIEGQIKTVTVKRTTTGEFYIYVVTKQECSDVLPRAGKAVGMDFGLKHFLTLDDGTVIDSPEWYKSSLQEIRAANRKVSRCKKDSNNRKRAVRHLAKVHERISNRRQDWFFKLANYLIGEYAVVCIEDLNMEGMKRLWGRKVSDLGYAEFVSILEWVASNAGTDIIRIDRWAPSSKTCHVCGTINPELTLKQRKWVCPCCGTSLDRDVNAAINIRTLGLSQKEAA